jgi:hypothetical protein
MNLTVHIPDDLVGQLSAAGGDILAMSSRPHGAAVR